MLGYIGPLNVYFCCDFAKRLCLSPQNGLDNNMREPSTFLFVDHLHQGPKRKTKTHRWQQLCCHKRRAYVSVNAMKKWSYKFVFFPKEPSLIYNSAL